jgi:hypothetical protein
MAFFDNLLNTRTSSPKTNQSLSGSISTAISAATKFFPSVSSYVGREAQKAQLKMQEASQMAKQTIQSIPSDIGTRFANMDPSLGLASNPSKPGTLQQFTGNRIIQPFVDIPRNAAVLSGRQRIDPSRPNTAFERAIGGLGVVGGMIPGIDDIAWGGWDAIKAAAAGKDIRKGFTGEEYTGLGDAYAGLTKNRETSNILNTAELPLLLLAGGAKSFRKGKLPEVNKKSNIDLINKGIKQLEDDVRVTALVQKGYPKKDAIRMVEDYSRPQAKIPDKYEGVGYKIEDSDTLSQPPKEMGEAPPPITESPNARPQYDLFRRIKEGEPLTDTSRVETPKVDVSKAESVGIPGSPFNTFRKRMSQSKSYQEAQPASQFWLDKMEEHFAKQGETFASIGKQKEKGIKNKNTRLLQEWSDIAADIAEEDGVKISRTFGGEYVTQASKEMSKQILSRPLKERTVGDVLATPFFAKKRTKARTEPLSKEAMSALIKEAFINRVADPKKQAKIKLSNEIVEEARRTTNVDSVTGGEKIKVTDRFQKLADLETPKIEYSGGSKNQLSKWLDTGLRSVSDRAARVKDNNKFYIAFLEPFKLAPQKLNKELSNISKLDDASFFKYFEKEFGYIPKDMSRSDMMARISTTRHDFHQAQAVNTFTENLEKASFKEPWLADLADDIFNQYVVKDIRKKGKIENIMATIRSNTGRGALGLNPASAINNLLELRRAFSAIGTKDIQKAMIRLAKGEDFAAKYGVKSIMGTALERGYKGKFGRVVEKADKGLFYMFDESEKLKDNILLAGLEEQGLSKGLTGKELNRYVQQKFSQYAIKYGKGEDIGLFTSPLVKTLFQFSQYVAKDIAITFDKVSGAAKGDKGDIKYLSKYTASTIAQAMAFKALLGTIGFGGQTGTAWDFFADIAEGDLPISPVVQSFLTLGQMINDELSGTELSDYEKVQREKELARSASVVGIPASNQLLFKTGATIQNQKRGYQEKFGGNVANPVSTDPANVAKTLLFGPSYDPKRQQYIKDLELRKQQGEIGGAGLNKPQSAVFKNLSDQEQVAAYYDKTIAKNKATQANQAIIKDIKEPKKPSRIRGAIDALIGKEPEVKAIDFGMKPQTPQEKKDHKALVYAALEAGQEVPDKDLVTVFLDDKKANDTDMKVREDVFSNLKTVFNSDSITEESKAAILKASGASQEAFDYYTLASESQNEKLQTLLPKLETMDKKNVMITLALGKMSLAGKSLVNSTTTDYLYNAGKLSKAEKKYLDNLKYDELSGKFYFDRDYVESGKGGMTPTQLKSFFNSLKTVGEILKSSKSKKRTLFEPKSTQGIDTRKWLSQTSGKPLVSGKSLWFTP